MRRSASSDDSGIGGRFGLVNLAYTNFRFTLQEPDAFVLARRSDENIFIRDRQTSFLQSRFGGLDPFVWIGIVQLQDQLGRGFKFQLVLGKLDDFWIWRDRGFAKVSQYHASVRLRDLFPRAEHHIVERLLKVKLGHWGDRRPEPAAPNHFAHRHDDFRVLFHDPVITQHLRIRSQRATGHGTPRNQRFNSRCFGRQEIVAHAVLEDLFGFTNFFDIDIQLEIAATQGMPHHQNIRLASPA